MDVLRLSLCVLSPALIAASLSLGEAQAQAPAKSDDSLVISGSVRVRYEAINGQPRVGFNDDDDLLNFRTRLSAEYKASRWRLVGELYDSRTYLHDSGTPVTTNEVNALEVVQAYVAADLGEVLGSDSKVSVQLGRATFNLGSRRFVAADDFRNTTNAYTGLKVDAAWKSGISATAIYMLPQIRRPFDADGLQDNTVEVDQETDRLQLWGGLATVPFGPKGAALQPSYYHLEEDDLPDLPTRNRSLDTFALRYFRDPKAGAFDVDIEAAMQTGSIRSSAAPMAAELDVSASYLHAEAGYKWAGPWRPRLAFEAEYVSGDKPGGDYNRFDTLFGTRRAEIAPAGLYNAVGRANMMSPGVRVEIEPSPRWDAMASYRLLYLEEETDSFSTTGVRDPAGRSGRNAGQQLDARVRYWLVPEKWRAEATFVVLNKGRFLKTAPNAPRSGDTHYVALDLTWSF